MCSCIAALFNTPFSQILGNSYQIGFRVVALGTQHKFSDEPIKHVLQLVRLVGSVDDVTVIFGIKLGLSAEFTTKKLGRVCEEHRTKKYTIGPTRQFLSIRTVKRRRESPHHTKH